MNMAERILQSTRELERRLDERDRANATDRRYDAAKAAISDERDRRWLHEQRRADAVEEDEERARLRRDGDLCLKHQTNYDQAFGPFGRKAAPPQSGESAYDYRRRLFTQAQSMLPDRHRFADMRAGDLDGHVLPPMEGELFKALGEEAKSPSGSNLPEDPSDRKARRDVLDDSTGLRHTEFRAKRSFIYNMSRPGRIVARLGPQRTGSGYTFPGIVFQGAR
jgi:hypothetical protein